MTWGELFAQASADVTVADVRAALADHRAERGERDADDGSEEDST